MNRRSIRYSVLIIWTWEMSDPNAASIENTNFRVHHHTLRLTAEESDPALCASVKRRIAAQYYYASLTLLDNEGTCQILEDKILPYISLVDDCSAKGVNNYADYALALAAHAGKSDVSKWKTNLRKSRPVLDIVKKVTDCKNRCHEWKISDKDLENFSANSDFLKQTSEKTERLKLGSACPELLIDVVKPVVCTNSFVEKRKLTEFTSKGASDGIFSFQKETGFCNSLSDFNKKVVGISDSNGVKSKSSEGLLKSGYLPVKPPNHENNFTDRGGLFHGGSFNNEAEERPDRNNVNHATGVVNTLRRFGSHEKYPQGSLKGGPVVCGNFSENTSRGGFNQGINSSSSRGGITGQNRVNSHTQPDMGMSSSSAGFFRTAKEELTIQNHKKYGSRGAYNNTSAPTRGSGAGGATGFQKRSLGTARRAGVHGKFVPPVRPTEEDDFGGMFGVKQPQMEGEPGEEIDERLKNIDPKMIETIRNEIMDIGAPVTWDDIAGLEFAKTTIQEIVVWPLLRPDIFTGLRKPPKGLLLFGPPGTGKTLIGKCIASQSQSTFFSISASSLTSKWIGDGEKMVRALFAVARVHQPSVVFIDEIDSLLTQRSDTEHESSRRIKTEFLVQLDGAATGDEDRILVVGATNRPQELDEAARRRLVKRLYIPLPEHPARQQIVERLMSSERCSLTDDEIVEIASLTEGYSGADMKNLCQEASLGPIRAISFSAMHQITADQVRPINVEDFKTALQRVRASVSNKDLDAYVQWDKTYGMGSGI